ncbi:MAG: hypothetical protein IKA97_00550 [Clostridia bacterium]|nr:hypothetical protein [Clostridia bacterium]
MNKNIKKWGFSDKDVELFKIIQLFAFAAAFLLIALLMRRAYYDFESWDYTAFLSEWFEHIKGMPGLSGFGADISDYTPMYKYIITIMTKLGTDSLTMYKNVSVFFDVVMSVFMGLLIYEITKDKVKGLITYAITLFMPTVFLNSAVWGQCDSIFTCFAVMSLYFIVKGKGGVGMAFFALSFSFKLQAIFFLPAIVIYCIKGKIKLLDLAYFPLTYILCALPAVFAGQGLFSALFGAYTTQVGEYPWITANAPNIYQILPEFYEDAKLIKMLVFFSMGVLCIIGTLLLYNKKEFNVKKMVVLAYLFAVLLPYVLPAMHERYFYMADVFAILFAVLYPKRAYISVLTVYPSLRAVVRYLFDNGNTRIDFVLVSFVMLVGVVCLVQFAMEEFNREEEPQIVKSTR